MTDSITFTLDGRKVEARSGETIWEVAKRNGTLIPHLCHADQPGYRPDGNCRACMVEISGEGALAASCIRLPTEGMTVTTGSERAAKARKTVIEMLASDQPEPGAAHDKSSHFWDMAGLAGVQERRFPKLESARVPLLDDSHVAMRVNLDACIHCNLCVRACRDVQVNDVIGLAYRGHDAKIVFDLDDPMGESTCVACGECVQACPTGALTPATLSDTKDRGAIDNEVNSVCPYCGVGCQITYKIKEGRIKFVDGRDGPANEQRLCIKGRFGFDYVSHPHRLTKPLIRREGLKKDLDVDPADLSTHFREATWEEAIRVAAAGLDRIKHDRGGGAIAGFGSAKCSNEEAYLFQKLIREAFGHNNVDHCTRLCHASSVAALIENVGSGAVTATFNEIRNSDVAILIGCNPAGNHPVAATYFKQFAKRGGKLITMDPRKTGMSGYAWRDLQFKAGSDVALLNAIMHAIIDEELHDEAYIASRTENFDELREHLKTFTPESTEPLTGIDPTVVREVARAFATAGAAMIFWGMGVSQHTHGTDNSRCLISLALMCGQVGRPGTGPASAARTEQRPRGVRCRFDSDGHARLRAGRQQADRREVPRALGSRTQPETRPDGCRNHRGRSRRPNKRHVHPRRKSRHVGSRSQACEESARQARASGRARPVPDRDGLLRGRRSSRIRLAGKDGHRHEYEPASPDGPESAQPAGRGARRLVHHG